MTTPRSATHVVIVEDHSLFAEALEIAVELEGYAVRRVNFPPGVHAPTTLLGPILRSHPRIALLDLDLGTHGNGMRLVQPLAAEGVSVVVVTGGVDAARWGEALWLGARTVLLKSAPLNAILAVLRRLHGGLPVMNVAEREELLQAWHERRHEREALRARLESLTNREAVVLSRLMAGKQVRDIARESVVSEATVRTQVKSILAKLGVSSQLAAVGAAHQVPWHPPPTA